MTERTTDPDPGRSSLDIDWLKTLAGALAAVTTAVLLSTLGAGGTLLGAALGSIAATVGTALYAQGLATSKRTVAKVQQTALVKVGVAQAEVRRAARQQGDDAAVGAHLEAADDRLAQAREDLDQLDVAGPQHLPWTARVAALPWKRVALVAAGTFAVVMIAISAFELLGGKPVSSYTSGTSVSGGTSFTRIADTSDAGSTPGDEDGGRQDPADQQPGQPADQPSDGASVEPDEEPTPTEEPTEAPTPTDEPTEDPEPTSEPTLPLPTPTR